MEDKTYYFSSEKLICVDDSRDKGFGVSFDFLTKRKTKEAAISGVSVASKGFSCVENSTLVFLFEDNQKIKLKSWNKFNCDGNSWFGLRKKELKLLQTKKLKKIKYQNGRNFTSLTYELKEEEESYFIEISEALTNKDIRIVTK